MRRRLTVLTVALLVAALPLVAAACGESKAAPQPSFSYGGQPRLVDIGGVALISGRPARVMLHIGTAQGLRIFIDAEHPLRSHVLRKVDAQDGSSITPQDIPLQGSAHSLGNTTVYALLTMQPLTPGWYRLDLVGAGRLISLAIDRHD